MLHMQIKKNKNKAKSQTLQTPFVGLEPTTLRLTAACSTD